MKTPNVRSVILAPLLPTLLVAGDGKVYLAGEGGTVLVVAAGTELEILAENDMGEPLMATPAIAGGTLFVRSRSTLYAVAETPPEKAPAKAGAP